MALNPTESRDELDKLQRKHTDNPEGRYFVPLANAYRKAGELDRAIEVLREGLEKHSDYLSAHIVLGRCLADMQAVPAAEAEFRYVLTLDPQNLIALRTLGELALAAGRIEDAQRWFRELLKVDPMNEDARRALDGIQVIPSAAGEPSDALPEGVETTAVPAWEEPAETEAPDPRSGGHRGRSAAEAADFETLYGGVVQLPAESGPVREDEPAFGGEGPAVVTETIAELYTRQGFYARAADVYRELIRRRGSNPQIEERLRRVEGLAAGAGNAAVAPPTEAPRAPIPKPVLENEPTALPAWDEPAPIEEPPMLPDEPPPAEDPAIAAAAAAAFADSFLAGFTPLDEGESTDFGQPLAGLDDPDEPEEKETAEASASTGNNGKSGESIRRYLDEVLAWRPAGRSEPEPARAETPQAEPTPAQSPEERTDPEGAAPAGFSNELFPWELAPEPQEAPEAAAYVGEPPAEPALESPAEPPPAPSPPTASDDEDLESFQAWLRSLKR